jgi:gamma-glutamyltranspeptidase/glutathione hydrolase
MTHPELADTFEAVAKHGREGFYKGRIAECKPSSTPNKLSS